MGIQYNTHELVLELITVPWVVTPRSVEAVTFLKNDEAKFKAASKNTYIHTHSFYSTDEFFMCTEDLEYHFVKCL